MVLFSDNGNLLFAVVFDLLPIYTRTINTSKFKPISLEKLHSVQCNGTVYNS